MAESYLCTQSNEGLPALALNYFFLFRRRLYANSIGAKKYMFVDIQGYYWIGRVSISPISMTADEKGTATSAFVRLSQCIL